MISGAQLFISITQLALGHIYDVYLDLSILRARSRKRFVCFGQKCMPKNIQRATLSLLFCVEHLLFSNVKIIKIDILDWTRHEKKRDLLRFMSVAYILLSLSLE